MSRYWMAGLLLCAGCTQTKSVDVATDGIYANISVIASGDGSSGIRTELKTGGSTSNDFVKLTDGDLLLVASGSDSRMLQEQSELGAVWYTASLPVDAADTPFKVSFIRGGASGCQTQSAPNSQVTLPAPFTITAPTPSNSFSRAHDAVPIAWKGASNDATSMSLEGTCIQPFSQQAQGNATSLSIPAGAIQDAPVSNYPDGGAPPPQTCQVTLTLTRSRQGQLDPGFGAGGAITASQMRSVSFTSAP